MLSVKEKNLQAMFQGRGCRDRQQKGQRERVARFTLTLTEPTAEKCCEFSYWDLLTEEQRGKASKRVMWREEQEGECGDYGDGYDLKDSFIDDDMPHDEVVVPDWVSTECGGFYINTGTLYFVPISLQHRPLPDVTEPEDDVFAWEHDFIKDHHPMSLQLELFGGSQRRDSSSIADSSQAFNSDDLSADGQEKKTKKTTKRRTMKVITTPGKAARAVKAHNKNRKPDAPRFKYRSTIHHNGAERANTIHEVEITRDKTDIIHDKPETTHDKTTGDNKRGTAYATYGDINQAEAQRDRNGKAEAQKGKNGKAEAQKGKNGKAEAQRDRNGKAEAQRDKNGKAETQSNAKTSTRGKTSGRDNKAATTRQTHGVGDETIHDAVDRIQPNDDKSGRIETTREHMAENADDKYSTGEKDGESETICEKGVEAETPCEKGGKRETSSKEKNKTKKTGEKDGKNEKGGKAQKSRGKDGKARTRRQTGGEAGAASEKGEEATISLEKGEKAQTSREKRRQSPDEP
ncbi:uncharacterized protein LOC143299005 [Babylonia areolata]|uniref:uncharacterized protein LOC143299005 n=1 Tax=Babylonia areolata TaxID=304850 RepID=UPI003FD09C18